MPRRIQAIELNKLQVLFRTDASLEIGNGHVMRCLTLANALRARGAQCRFICREHSGNLLELIRKQGFDAVALPLQKLEAQRPANIDEQPLVHATWLGSNWPTDAEQTRIGLGETPVDLLVVDHYALDIRWESAMRPRCRKLMVIDDLADRIHDCDLLLDQNLYKDVDHRYDGRVPAHCCLMLGPNYALLQSEYAELQPRVPPREGPVRRVLVYFGGADADNLTGRAIAAFLCLAREDVALDVVINPASPYAASIRRMTEGRAQITLHESLPTLAPLMVQADLAIGAGGATSWERCCLGLPALVITLAENQRPIAAELDRRGLIRWLGHKNQVSEAKLAEALKSILDTGLLPEWSASCKQTVDGRGTERVVSILMLNAQTRLKARLARMDDEALILRWANGPPVRKNAFVFNAIGTAAARVWFSRLLRDPEHCRLYMVETEDGFPVGQVRFELSDEGWEIDYSLDADARGRGLEKPLLQTAILALRAHTNGVILFGRVKDSNAASRRIFDALGFGPKGGGGGCLSIAICSDAGSWINTSVPELVLAWLADGQSVAWAHVAGDLPGGDLCFYLSYGRIVDAPTRARYRNNLVVHESDLPKGRGWSPMSWQILDGAERIPVTLLEAVAEVDAGPIYLQEWIQLVGNELSPEWRELQAHSTRRLCLNFVAQYPAILEQARQQEGEPSFHRRRRPKDSELDPTKTIIEQFNILRIVDNESYPAFFEVAGKSFILRIENGQETQGR